MNAIEKEAIKMFESHARAPDRVPQIYLREQLAVLKTIAKGIEEVRKEVAELRSDIKQESMKKLDDGK